MVNPLVSVIIPNYCHSVYLVQRIESVINQTYNNIEVIILDDASPDNGASKSIIERYRNNPHISQIVYNDHNSGSTFKQWERGFQLAKGELIWIAESDDYCEKTFLEKLVPEFENDGKCTLAFTRSLWVNAESIPINEKNADDEIERLDGLQFVQRHLSLGNDVQNASSALFKKITVESIDNEYTKYKGCGDQLFWIEISLQGNVAYIHSQLNYFRFHDTNVTSKLYANGENLTELHNIYLYQQRHKLFLNKKTQYTIRHIFITWINQKVEDAKIRRELYKLWDPYHTDKIYVILSHIKQLPYNVRRSLLNA